VKSCSFVVAGEMAFTALCRAPEMIPKYKGPNKNKNKTETEYVDKDENENEDKNKNKNKIITKNTSHPNSSTTHIHKKELIA
jgi:hypothetical protein